MLSAIQKKPCLSQGFYFCTNIMTKKQVGEERVYSSYISTLLFITKESHDWISSRSRSRSWYRGHEGMFSTGLLPLACSACSLINPRLPDQRWHHPQGDLPPWSLIEKMPYSWISWRHFPNWSPFLCDNSSLCQVDTKLASTGSLMQQKTKAMVWMKWRRVNAGHLSHTATLGTTSEYIF